MGLIAAALGGALQGGGEAATKAMASAQQFYQLQDLEKMRDELAGAREAAADARRFAHAEKLQRGQQDFTAGESQKGRDFQAGEAEKGRAFQASESEKGRTFQAGEGDKNRAADLRRTQISAGASLQAAREQIAANAPQRELATLQGKELKQAQELRDGLLEATKSGDAGKIRDYKAQIDAFAYKGDKLDKQGALKAAEIYKSLAISALDPDQKADYEQKAAMYLASIGLGQPGLVAGAAGGAPANRPPISSFGGKPAAPTSTSNLTGSPLLK